MFHWCALCTIGTQKPFVGSLLMHSSLQLTNLFTFSVPLLVLVFLKTDDLNAPEPCLPSNCGQESGLKALGGPLFLGLRSFGPSPGISCLDQPASLCSRCLSGE